MESGFFNDEHLLFRRTARKFAEAEMKPYAEEWEREGIVF